MKYLRDAYSILCIVVLRNHSQGIIGLYHKQKKTISIKLQVNSNMKDYKLRDISITKKRLF